MVKNKKKNNVKKQKTASKKKATKKRDYVKIADLHYPTVIIRLTDKVLKELGLDAKEHTRADANRAILERAGLDKV